ncbi:MAG TPA: class I SAM-dependent methyltransferase [Candidatus Sulfotelmatobacter sp.]|nr:class I SAM-dependent methyltransferase [Candidatus Sulfotelmatobacter sp.]
MVGPGESGTAAGVRAQYEAYPYPPRDPADERKRLIIGSPSHLDELTHYCFAGRLERSRPLRVLFAGGGTGDGLIMLATQAKARGIALDLTYLDLSAAAAAIAEARAGVRGLSDIRFRTGSLLDVAALAPGPYDYIDCCGVLHHLPDPSAGLAALAAELAPRGAMGLMLYGALGRTGVYPVQAALKTLAAAETPARQVAIARRLLKDLPESNWLKRNPFLGDHLRGEDAALYDLLLHSRDRAYSVPEIAALLDGAGLRVAAFIEPVRYQPATWLSDAALIERTRALPPLAAAALAENLSGALKTHVFYAVRASAGDTVAKPGGPDTVPVWRDEDARALVRALGESRHLALDFDGHKVKLAVPDGAGALARLIDGRRHLGAMQGLLGLDWFALKARFDRLYGLLNPLNLMFLRC